MVTEAAITILSAKSKSPWEVSWAPRNKCGPPNFHIRVTHRTVARSLSGLKPLNNLMRLQSGTSDGKMRKTLEVAAWACARREPTTSARSQEKSQERKISLLPFAFLANSIQLMCECLSKLFLLANYATQTSQLASSLLSSPLKVT